MTDFQKDIVAGIPDPLPAPKPYDPAINHAPKRKDILTPAEKRLALKNALRKFPDTPHREELMYLIVGSGYELAHNSVQAKQTDRYLSMLDSYYTFIAEFPESARRKEVDRMAQEAKDYLAKNQKNDTQDGN